MKKILFIIGSLGGGGAEKVLYDILNNISYEKYEIELFLLENSGIYLKKLQEKENLKVKIEFLFSERKDRFNNILYRKIKTFLILVKLYFYCRYPLLIKKLRNKNYDIEVAFLEGYPTMLLANRKSTAKKINWIHIDLKKHRIIGISRGLERKNLKEIEEIICVSEDSKKSILSLYPENKNKVKVIYNPIDKNNILEKSKEKIELKKDKLNIITIGRLSKQKGYDILLKSHNKLLKEGLDYNLIILGEGSERKNLEKYIKEKKIENNTQLLGFKENPYPYLKAADIFVSSSRYEGFSLVVAEAICLEKPIVSTRCTGPLELLENGKYGLMAESENVEDLSEKMKKLILDKKLREEYSILSKERAKVFEINKTIERIESIIDI